MLTQNPRTPATWTTNLAAQYSVGRQRLHQVARAGDEAHVFEGGKPEAECRQGGGPEGRFQDDEAGVQRICLGVAAIAQLLQPHDRSCHQCDRSK